VSCSVVLGDWLVLRDRTTVSETRRQVARLATRIVGYGEIGDRVELMADELMGNAVKHGGGDKVRVRVTTDTRTVRVEIHDCGTTPPRIPEDPDVLAESGRGLLLVRAFSHRCGLEHDEHGTTAWFEVLS
jgi:anti-sigma regulatory factor (Ser/Thr protein kinase)